jgi:hypothetical protein
LKIYFSFSAKRSINSRHPRNDEIRKPRLTPLQWICVRDKSAIRLCSMPSVRGWILIPYLPHKAIKSSVSTNPPSRKAASARFNDVLSRASSCRCRHFPVRSALVPVFGLPQHTVRAYGCDAPSTAGHPNPVLRRLPRKTTESTAIRRCTAARRLRASAVRASIYSLRSIPLRNILPASKQTSPTRSTTTTISFALRNRSFIMGYHPTCSFRKVTSS